MVQMFASMVGDEHGDHPEDCEEAPSGSNWKHSEEWFLGEKCTYCGQTKEGPDENCEDAPAGMWGLHSDEWHEGHPCIWCGKSQCL